MVNFLPILEILPKILPADKVLSRNIKLRDDYARAQMAQHAASYDQDHPRDYIDAYISKMQDARNKGLNTSFEGRIA